MSAAAVHEKATEQANKALKAFAQDDGHFSLVRCVVAPVLVVSCVD